MTSNTGLAKGYLFAILAAVLWGISGSAVKFLFLTGLSPFQLVQLRMTLAAVILFFWLLVRDRSLLRIDRADIGYFALLGSFGLAGLQFTYLLTISKIQVAAAVLLQYLAPGLIALHAMVFFNDRLGGWTLAALFGSLGGCYLVVGAYSLELISMNWVGIVSGLLSAVAFAWYSIHGEHGMRRYNPWTVLAYAMAFGALCWNILYSPLQGLFHGYSPVQWAGIVYVAIMGTLLPFGLYLEGVNRIRSTRASITATLEPITAGVVSWVFLGEVLMPLQLVGAALVIGSIVVLQLRQESDDKIPALIRARSRYESRR
ncbi:MAG: EamA family transporter [Desulfobacterales bacterium]|jgi:drug/metabolite transporter (DMT)-like permease